MTKQSLDRVEKLGGRPPFVWVERLRYIAGENGYAWKLDSDGDSQDGHIILYHAVSEKLLLVNLSCGWFWYVGCPVVLGLCHLAL